MIFKDENGTEFHIVPTMNNDSGGGNGGGGNNSGGGGEGDTPSIPPSIPPD